MSPGLLCPGVVNAKATNTHAVQHQAAFINCQTTLSIHVEVAHEPVSLLLRSMTADLLAAAPT